jgi:hypothetical protein
MNAGNLTIDAMQSNLTVHLPEWPLTQRDTDIPLILLTVLQGRIKIIVTNLLSRICKLVYLTQPPMVSALYITIHEIRSGASSENKALDNEENQTLHNSVRLFKVVQWLQLSFLLHFHFP